jgi:hypothetical protein
MEGMNVDMASATAQDHKGFDKPIFGQGHPRIRLLR